MYPRSNEEAVKWMANDLRLAAYMEFLGYGWHYHLTTDQMTFLEDYRYIDDLLEFDKEPSGLKIQHLLMIATGIRKELL